MTIDAHVHFWNYQAAKDAWITDDMKILKQDFLPRHLSARLAEHQIDGCIAIQASQDEAETIFLANLAATNSIIKAVVGWVDLQHENIEERLTYFSQFPVIKGWRHIVQAEPDDFLANKNFKRGIQKLSAFKYTYDILVYPHQLKPTLDFISAFPEQQFVIDHCAKPDIKHHQLDDWKNYMKEISRHPHVSCKLSGLLTEAIWQQWNVTDFYPYFDTVFEYFGTSRLMFGSDWPVLQLSGNYEQWINLINQYLIQFDESEKQKVFGLNAVKFYKL